MLPLCQQNTSHSLTMPLFLSLSLSLSLFPALCRRGRRRDPGAHRLLRRGGCGGVGWAPGGAHVAPDQHAAPRPHGLASAQRPSAPAGHRGVRTFNEKNFKSKQLSSFFHLSFNGHICDVRPIARLFWVDRAFICRLPSWHGNLNCSSPRTFSIYRRRPQNNLCIFCANQGRPSRRWPSPSPPAAATSPA